MEEKVKIRQTAYKVPIAAIIKGRYVKDSEGVSPNYIEFGQLKFSRVNLIAIVVSVEGNAGMVNSIAIDDGTEKISLRSFEQGLPQDILVGDIIMVIGRPREFGNEKYIVPEIIKKTNEKWMRIRNLELQKLKIEIKEEMTEEKKEDVVEEEAVNGSGNSLVSSHEQIRDFIIKNDNGQGVEKDFIIENLKTGGCEKIIEDMLKEGIIFENMPGRIKAL
jgi:RPA family protein